ncbi:MAG: hypothetical protein V4477_17075 [Pseudomonadota bacterium]
MTKLNLTIEHWAVVRPDLVAAGSAAQARNVLEMATQDIAAIAADRDRTERNRDMWKGQCERQAEQLTKRNWQPIATAPKNGTEILLWWKHCKTPSVGSWSCDDLHAERKWAHKALAEGWRSEGDACIPVNQADCTHWQPLPEGPTFTATEGQGNG